jgi:hypothetical protein
VGFRCVRQRLFNSRMERALMTEWKEVGQTLEAIR